MGARWARGGPKAVGAPPGAGLAVVNGPPAVPGGNLLAPPAAEGALDDDAVLAYVSIPSTRVLAERVDRLTRMVRTRDWKYVLYPSGAEELYDTAADPSEMSNLAASPEQAARRDELRARLAAWLERTAASGVATSPAQP